jgi:hypothetical protein
MYERSGLGQEGLLDPIDLVPWTGGDGKRGGGGKDKSGYPVLHTSLTQLRQLGDFFGHLNSSFFIAVAFNVRGDGRHGEPEAGEAWGLPRRPLELVDEWN